MTSEALDTVLVDLGGVVVRWEPTGPFADLLDPEETATFFAEIDFFAFNRLQDAGRSWADGRADVAARFPHRAWLVDRYVDRFDLALPGPVPGTDEVLEALRTHGVRLFGLTNFSVETYPHAAVVAPAIGLLEDVLVSGAVGLAKPDPAIFDLAAERFGLVPARTAFVDDTPMNVEAARGCGFVGIDFTDADTLTADLQALGLLPGVGTGRSS